MTREDLLRYLKDIDVSKLSPLEAIVAQAEAIGDPALPLLEQTAALKWVNAAYLHWESQFPVEQPLASEFRKLLPLAAALAVVDPVFMTPGAHPFHRLLDTLQGSLIGWQSRLGRPGQNLEKVLKKAAGQAIEWFSEDSADIDTIYAEVEITTNKDRSRAQRMAQRVSEAERGRLKVAHSKLLAAQMINEQLAMFHAPAAIGEFLRGPWYESGQLVLLKFGANSQEWKDMSATTATLLISLQPEPSRAEGKTGSSATSENTETAPEPQDGSHRQRVFEAITRLPKEIKNWLLSLQHDRAGVREAIATIESVHMRVLRQRDLDLVEIESIAVKNGVGQAETLKAHENIDQLLSGQWFLMTEGENEPVRVQLALKTETEQQLLFTNHVGIKAMQKNYADFSALMDTGQAIALHQGPGFSLSLAYAANIRNQDDLAKLLEANQQDIAEGEKQATQKQQALDDAQEQAIEREREQALQLKQEREDAERDLEQAQALQEEEEAAKLQIEYDEAINAQRTREQVEPDTSQQEQSDGEPPQDEVAPETTAEDTADVKKYIHRELTEQTHSSGENTKNTNDSEPEEDSIQLNLTMGSWLGFHDGDTPLMAKLAVHDRNQDTYIFVNRNGIKMRGLNKQELLGLIDKGLVDILETRSNFREEITRIRNKHKK